MTAAAAGGAPSVFLVDDHRLFLSGVVAELGDRFEIAGMAGDVDEAVAGILATRPDVVLLDVHMPGGGGLAVLEAVKAAVPAEGAVAEPGGTGGGAGPRFLALSVSDAPEDVIAVVRAGARGYVTKTIEPDALADAVRRVHAGDAVFSPRLAGFVLDAFAGEGDAGGRPVDPELDQLTAREREVLRLIARGYAYKQVARRLNISIKTVETHVSAVLRKLQLSSRYELTRWASDRRLI